MKAYTESEHNAAMGRLAADLEDKGARIVADPVGGRFRVYRPDGRFYHSYLIASNANRARSLLDRTSRKIAGLDPWDYAALWGSETRDGAAFYNLSSENQPKDRAYFGVLLGAIGRLLIQIGKRPMEFDASAFEEVSALRDWVQVQYTAAES